jgi:hypothetical protein
MLPDRTPCILLARKKNFWAMRYLTITSNDDTIRISDTLRPTGSLRFPVAVEGQTDHRARLGLSGTPFMFTGDSTGSISVENVPAGTYAAIIKSQHEGYRAVRCTLRIRSAEHDQFTATLTIPREAIAYSPAKTVVVETDVSPRQPIPPKPSLPAPQKPAVAPQLPVAKKPVETPPPAIPAPAEIKTVAPIRLPPVVKAPADTFVGIFDTLLLTGTATDDGEIVSMEWDIGAVGRFFPTDDGRIQLPPQKTARERMRCIFRATDNDGLSATDTMVVRTGLLWRTISPPKELLGRNGHSLVNFNDELFIVGGNRTDILTSRDGISWTLLTEAAPFGKLFGHTTTVFNNRLWVIGGKNGPNTFNNVIWSSSNGVRWERTATIPFDKRMYHASVAFDGRLWVIGGLTDSETEPFRNDVWSTRDGINWTLAAKQAPFAERYGHACTVLDDRMIILGGFCDAVGKPQTFGDLWESTDGSEWRLVNANVPIAKEQFHVAVALENRLWAVGGHAKIDNTDRFTDIQFTVDGQSWTNLTPGQKGGVRSFCAAVPWHGRILISPPDSKLWLMR